MTGPWAKALMALTILLGIASISSASLAADPNEVEDLIREGIALRRAGSDGRALPLFRKAHELAHTPRTAAQLGLVEFALGYALEAERHLSQGLAAPTDVWISKNRAVLDDALAKVRATIGAIEVSGSPSGAQVLLNGQTAGSLPLGAPLRVGQGPAVIEVKAPGHLSASKSVEVTGGQTQKFSFQLVPDPAAVATDAGAAADQGAKGVAGADRSSNVSGRSILGWSLVGAGAAAVAGGAIWLFSIGDCNAPAGFECTRQPPSKAPAWVLLGAGAAVGVAGGIVLLTRPKEGVEVGLGPSSFFVRGSL